MLKLLYDFSKKIQTTIFHPQWIANRLHLQRRLSLSTIENRKILDVGSGNSSMIHYINNNNILITVDYPTTANAYEIKPDIYADAKKLPFFDEEYDSVFLFEVLEHIEDDILVINELHRVIKNNGQLHLSVPTNYPLHDKPYDFRRYTQYGITQILENSGFHIKEMSIQGNSITTSIQLLNLMILDVTKTLDIHHPVLTLILFVPAYLLCLINNFIAMPFLHISWTGNLNLGLSLIAVKTTDQE